MKKISIEEAQLAVFDAAKRLETCEVSIADAAGRILAEDIRAAVTQPPFRRSAMDGYAVRSEDVRDASESYPVTLPVCGSIFAGDAPVSFLDEGCALRIMTGAPLPDNADVVVPQEQTDCGEKEVQIYRALKREANCVPKGEDFWEGDLLAAAGGRVDPYTAAAAAAGGLSGMRVYRTIRAAVITTGSELAEPGERLAPGQIYDANRVFFRARLEELGCKVICVKSVSDDPDEIAGAVEEAAGEADLILTTGGVSVGQKDYLPDVFERLHAKTIFCGIAIKPGSPTMAAVHNGSIILALSGNPYAAIAMFEMLFPYFEKKAVGRQNGRLTEVYLPTENGYPKSSIKRRLIRGILCGGRIRIPQDQRNGQLHGGIGSNCLVDIPAQTAEIRPGEIVKAYIL